MAIKSILFPVDFESEFPLSGSRRILLAGDPATRIAETAKKEGFDFIMMPTHAGFFRRMLLGSTTAKALNDADRAVVTTQHAQTISPREIKPREFMCTLGLQADSERVLRFAQQLTEAAHSKLTIVHALPKPELPLGGQLDLEHRVDSAERQQVRKRIDELQRTTGSRARVEIVSGPSRTRSLKRRSGCAPICW